MEFRRAVSTQGKLVSFKVDDFYYYPGRDKSLVFGKKNKKYKFCVCYTGVWRDKGTRVENRFGVPTWVSYDNGSFANQDMTYFNDRAEAERDLKLKERLTPKLVSCTWAYTDVFLVENN